MREAILTKGIFKFMKSGTKSVLRILISIVYIIWGIMAPVTAFQAIIALDINAIISAAIGVLMLLAGIFGLVGIKAVKCRIFAVIIFIFAAISVVMSLTGGNLDWRSIITAVLSWLFIICL